MQTPEGKIKDKVKKVINDHRVHGIYAFWPVQTGYGASTLDCLGSYHGEAFAIETKADPSKRLTDRQHAIVDAMYDAGMMVFVIYDDTTLKKFDDWLNSVLLFAKGVNKFQKVAK